MRSFFVLVGSILATAVFGQAPQICLFTYQPMPELLATSEERRDSTVVSIQCVFHILYAQNADNLSEAQIQSQLLALNRDFSGNPQLTCPVPSYYTQRIASANIRFCLATVDPIGQTTTGITRTKTFAKFGSVNLKNAAATAFGGKDPWPSDRYLNIWVVPFVDNVLGYSSGVATGHFHDGVFLNTSVVGTIGALEPNYALGHTLSHEIGHFLGLNHIWGTEPCSCTDDDGIADTPAQECYNYSCAIPQKSCGQIPMHSNLMDYTYDACRGFFTKGQVQVMRTVLANFRKNLIAAASCSPPQLQTIPTLNCTDVVLGYSGEIRFDYTVYDISGKVLLSGVSLGDYLRIDLSSLPSGIYLLSKKSTEQQTLEKIVICR